MEYLIVYTLMHGDANGFTERTFKTESEDKFHLMKKQLEFSKNNSRFHEHKVDNLIKLYANEFFDGNEGEANDFLIDTLGFDITSRNWFASVDEIKAIPTDNENELIDFYREKDAEFEQADEALKHYYTPIVNEMLENAKNLEDIKKIKARLRTMPGSPSKVVLFRMILAAEKEFNN